MSYELIVCQCQKHGRIKNDKQLGYEFLSKNGAKKVISSMNLSEEEKDQLLADLNNSELPDFYSGSNFLEEEAIASAVAMCLRANNYKVCPWYNKKN